MTGQQLANKAVELLHGETIYYNEAKRKALGGPSGAKTADCQAFMEMIVRQCGGKMDYAGSNDMFRNACSWVGTIAEAKALGCLTPGCALFIREFDGGEPAKYKEDGKGNASHVGMYIGANAYYDSETGKQCDVAHSSASRGKACGSTLKNGWTHVGLWKNINFEQMDEEENLMAEAYVVAPSGSNVNMRTKQSTSAALATKVPINEKVMANNLGNGWAEVVWGKYRGYMKAEFLASSPMAGEDTPFDGEEDSSLNDVLAKAREVVAALEKIIQR